MQSISLREARDNANVSQVQLAEKLGVNRVTVSRWEAPDRSDEPDASHLPIIASVCDASVAALAAHFRERADRNSRETSCD